MVRPVNVVDGVAVVAAVVHVTPPSVLCSTVYPVNVDPPVLVGAAHVRAIDPFVGVATMPVGDAAFALGVTVALA